MNDKTASESTEVVSSKGIGFSAWTGDLRGPAGCAVNFRALAKSWREVAEKFAPDDATRERAKVRAEIYDDCARDIERSLGPLPNIRRSDTP